MKCEVVKDWTHTELRRELLLWRNIELGQTQFYKWLPYALIKKGKRVYSDKDRKKLLKFAEFMQRYNRLSIARTKLLEHLVTNPEEYPNE